MEDTNMVDVTGFSLLFLVVNLVTLWAFWRFTLFRIAWLPAGLIIPIAQLYALGEWVQIEGWFGDFVRYHLSNVGFPGGFIALLGLTVSLPSVNQYVHADTPEPFERRLLRGYWAVRALLRGCAAAVVVVAAYEAVGLIAPKEGDYSGLYDIGDVTAAAIGVAPVALASWIALRRIKSLTQEYYAR